MTREVRLDIRNSPITLDDASTVKKCRWVLQSTNPVEDLWQSCTVFDNEVDAVHDFAEKSKKAGYDNFINGISLPDPTGE